MPHMDDFESIVTLSKRNHRYYGPTESQKMASSLSEIDTDLITIFYEMNNIRDNLDAFSSGYLLPSGSAYSLYDIKRQVYNLESKIDQMIYIQANVAEVLV